MSKIYSHLMANRIFFLSRHEIFFIRTSRWFFNIYSHMADSSNLLFRNYTNFWGWNKVLLRRNAGPRTTPSAGLRRAGRSAFLFDSVNMVFSPDELLYEYFRILVLPEETQGVSNKFCLQKYAFIR